MEFKKELIETIKANKATEVFINEAGEWLFFQREGYSSVSAEEVLGESKPASEDELPKSKKGK
jgi:hypothetical protein